MYVYIFIYIYIYMYTYSLQSFYLSLSARMSKVYAARIHCPN